MKKMIIRLVVSVLCLSFLLGCLSLQSVQAETGSGMISGSVESDLSTGLLGPDGEQDMPSPDGVPKGQKVTFELLTNEAGETTGAILVDSYASTYDTELVIPSEYEGYPVTTVGQQSLDGYGNPTYWEWDGLVAILRETMKVTVPATVTKFEDYVIAYGHNTKFYFTGSAPEFAENALGDKNGDGYFVDIYYPAHDPSWMAIAGQQFGGRVDWHGSGHEYDEGVITVPPTCTSSGKKLCTCRICGWTEEESVPSGCNYDEGVITVQPTCTTSGKRCYTCTGCGKTSIYGVSALGHSYAEGVCTTCGEADPKYVVLTPKYPSVSFEDEITVNVYFAASGLEEVVDMGLVIYNQDMQQYSIDNADAVTAGYTYEKGTGLYRVTTPGIASKHLGDTLYFAVYAKRSNGTYVYSKLLSYSPKTYAYTQLKAGPAELKPLMVAMLNYGAAAQTYFQYNTDALVNADLSAEQKVLAAAYNGDMMPAVSAPTAEQQGSFADTGKLLDRYRTVSFDGAFSVNYYCTFSTAPVGNVTMYYWNSTDLDVFTEKNAVAVTMEKIGNGEYRASVPGIAAKHLDRGFGVAFAYTDETGAQTTDVQSYSIGTYCNSSINKGYDIAPLSAATAVYGYYAKQYFA